MIIRLDSVQKLPSLVFLELQQAFVLGFSCSGTLKTINLQGDYMILGQKVSSEKRCGLLEMERS